MSWRPGHTGLAVVLAAVLCGTGASASAVRTSVIALDSETVAVGAGEAVLPVASADQLLPDSRVLAGTPDSARELAEERSWLASGTVPAVPELGDSTMVRDALLDLRTLGLPTGVPVAAGHPAYGYVWPRDSALVAVALARTGHPADAEAVLDFLQRVQPPSGLFAARYRSDGTVPDDRAPQLDGVGWALWALASVTDGLPVSQRAAFVGRYRSLLDRSTAAALASLDPDGLPRASSDYWERPERRLTLATAALVLAGLRAAGSLYAIAAPATSSDARTPARLAAAANRLDAAVTGGFGPGYPRYRGGAAGSTDLGAAFLLPPFAASADPGVVAAWRRGATGMLRPAGGLAPGGSWPDDGISWTTATSSYALTAAATADRPTALAWLRWLDTHRTAAGTVPEKVLADGRPASVAPLAWSAAAVVLAAADLQP